MHHAAMIQSLITSLLLLYPSGPHQECIRSRSHQIAHQVEIAIRAHRSVKAESLIAIGFMETHLGCARGIGWGASLLSTDRGNPAMTAARILETGLRVCRSEEGSFRFYRTGRCSESFIGSPYARRAISLSRRIAIAAMTRDQRRQQRRQ
jgi:hypothetical protein